MWSFKDYFILVRVRNTLTWMADFDQNSFSFVETHLGRFNLTISGVMVKRGALINLLQFP